MGARKCGRFGSYLRIQKTDKARRRIQAAASGAVVSELLESRMLLSVSASSILGPFTTATGGEWTYALSASGPAGSASGTATRTNIGPTTAPSGQSAIEQDVSVSETLSNGTSATSTSQDYYAITAAGLVQYAEVSARTNVTQTDTFSPPKIALPTSLTANVPVTETDTVDTSVATTVDGNTTTSNSSSDESTTFTLTSETLSSRTVPAGTFKAYVITIDKTVTRSDGTQFGDVTTIYFSPQVGIVEQDDTTSGGVTQSLTLTSDNIPGDALQFAVEPVDTPAGDTMPNFTVDFVTVNDTVDTSVNGSVTLTLQGDNGTLSGASTVTAANGVANFSGLSVDQAGTYSFLASSSQANGPTTSDTFTITGQTLTWSGGGDGSSWSDPKNWQEDQAPQNGDSLVYPISSSGSSIDDISGLSINTIDIQGSNYTLSSDGGDQLSVTGGVSSEGNGNTYKITTDLVGAPTFQDTTGDLTIAAPLEGDGGIVFDAGSYTIDQIDTYTGNTTLESGATIIGDSATEDLGTGTLVIGAGAQPVTLEDGGTGPIDLTNELDYQSGATLDTDPDFKLSGDIVLKGADALNPVNSTDQVTISGGTIKGSGTLTVGGNGTVIIDDPVLSGAALATKSGVLNLGANLGDIIGNQLTLLGGTVQLQTGLAGSGGIDVQGGTLGSAIGAIAGFAGQITLESGGTIDDLDSADGNGLGAHSTLDLKGGTLKNDTGANATLDNPVSIEGNVTILGGNLGTFLGGTMSVQQASQLTLPGSGLVELTSVDNGSATGTPTLTIVGSAPVDLSGVNTSVSLQNDATDAIGGIVGGNAGVVLNGTNTSLQLSSGQVGSILGALLGNGSIDIASGTLQVGTAGVSGFSGQITLESGGTIEDQDIADTDGLGTGTLNLNGGLFLGVSGGTDSLNNPTVVGGDVGIKAGQLIGFSVNNAALVDAPIVAAPNANARVKFLNNLRILAAGQLTVYATGQVTVYSQRALRDILSGSGTVVINGGELDISQSNPSFTGNVVLNGGTIDVTQPDALGTGKLTATGQSVVQSVATINDPILDNLLTVQSGTLVLEGLLTFPAGITVDTGATLIVEGSTSQIVSSGALTGGGTILVEGGTFSTPGGSGGFTGSVQFQGGQITPTLGVTDPGGVATGSPFPATAMLWAPGISPTSSLQGVTPTLTYYVGTQATGTGSSTAPSVLGTYTVVASFAGSTNYSSTTSAPVTFTITSAEKLVFLIQPHDSEPGRLAPIIVLIKNAHGKLATSDDSAITLTVVSGPGTLVGTVTVKAHHGIAIFNHLSLTKPGIYTLKATDGSDTSALSHPFRIVVAPLHHRRHHQDDLEDDDDC